MFEITGRGVAAAIGEIVSTSPGKAIAVVIHTPSGRSFTATAFQEYVLRRQPIPLEKSVFLLADLTKAQIPTGSQIEVAPSGQ
jgi:hypothetical protein